MTKQLPIANPARTASLMKEYDIQMKKSLGQNFLIDSNILDKMLAAGRINQHTTVIEIGPGIGALTEFLAQTARQVYAFEIDQRFVDILSETLADYDNVKVIHQDILKVDFQAEAYAELAQAEDLVVCANLPYYITTPIIMHLIQANLPFDRLIMMMQKEVAERMTAAVGTKAYGSLSLAIQNQMQAELAFTVPKTVFIPRPNVDSAVLILKRKSEPSVPGEQRLAFEHFVKAAFSQRRKTLWNNLKNYPADQALSIDQWQKIFYQSQIASNRRAESLDLAEFIRLFKQYQQVQAESLA
ncbi:16S rRNA (adenine(1518)-N(6)/adenine(1519)-N(6))-dimethyltransferase RsmA [Ignavigranum ruoffiae]|uniref:16S rRNA (adenine(1518)-N(6)/adenine(1519)-N(6))- dimethyltransferase RsmA n=1 Tax=Ignavigranum ruoffiae TaxID=89093 RepID=UPI0024AD9E6E|nr:16S rRNA (adenine(1518)-N(6)/adenine(1519)-N(6))-dimethyltransferase RsmA [Ignavigranum ruoffiae]